MEPPLSDRRILILEDEQILYRFVEAYFAELGPRYVVSSAGSVSAALEIFKRSSIDLVVLDHQRPGKLDGLELLREIRRKGLPIQVVLVADKGSEGDGITALAMGCTNFLVKPFSYETMAELLFNMLQPQQGFKGRVVGIRLEDIIQMFCYRKESTLIRVFSEGSRGSIYVHDGGIAHAECGSITGVEAFYEMLGWEAGEFLSQVVFTVPEQTLFMDWQSLLMEGIRQRDEIRHALDPFPQLAGEPVKLEHPGNGKALPAVHAQAQAVSAQAESAKRIMIVDDSRFIRKIVQELLQSDPGLLVAGYATNGQEALEKIDELRPDLILLDWDMPVMKGSTALMHIMIRSPCPVVILSGFVGGVGANPFDLLCLGGVDFLRKPQNNWRVDGRAEDLVNRIKEACGIKFNRIRRVKVPPPVKQPPVSSEIFAPSKFLSVFASSTGGCTDLIRIIPFLPKELPTSIVVIHDMQQEAIGAFVDYLDRRSKLEVRPAESGATLVDGVCYVHPATVPLDLSEEDGRFILRMPSDVSRTNTLDHFLMSASKVMGENLVAVLLSGGPSQGMTGLRAVKQARGTTMVQDPASSVDPRMAEAALLEGIIDHKCSADSLAETFQKLIK
jgi:two-component system, chemotaxis family, protein-glutamate methylesterase/glutaminase